MLVSAPEVETMDVCRRRLSNDDRVARRIGVSRARALTVALLLTVAAEASAAGVRGEADARQAGQRLLEQVGGAAAWRSRTLEVTERIYLRSGAVGELRIVRDFERPARLVESTIEGRKRVEWVAPDGGWTARDGERREMPAATLAAELRGLRQEPYAVYHRLAEDDAGLRLELRDGDRLLVFDHDERLLSWFQVAANGVLLGWGSFFDGEINQHYYGPLADFGGVKLPRFGATSDGRYRFEYASARLTDAPLTAPGASE
jgi:hypothetical protein